MAMRDVGIMEVEAVMLQQHKVLSKKWEEHLTTIADTFRLTFKYRVNRLISLCYGYIRLFLIFVL